jgi:hypothetical protein
MSIKFMKVMKEKSRTYNGKDYYKYKVNLPEKNLKDAKIECGDDLEVKSEKGKLILKKKSK